MHVCVCVVLLYGAVTVDERVLLLPVNGLDEIVLLELPLGEKGNSRKMGWDSQIHGH